MRNGRQDMRVAVVEGDRTMPRVASLAALLLLGATARAGDSPLAAEVGRSRPVVLVSPDAADPLARELAGPQARAALVERQVVVFTVLAGQGARQGVAMAPEAVAALLATLKVRADGARVILLLGRDGGVKLRGRRFSVAEICAAIDAMPMRRQEARRP